MRINTVIKLDLETRAKELKGLGKSFEDISKILSSESKQNVSKSSIFRYFNGNERAAAQAIEKSDKLKVKIAEAEISTIEQRLRVIKGLLDISESAEFDNIRVNAFKAANEALDSLDTRLGKLRPNSQVTLNNITMNKVSELSDSELLEIIEHDSEI
jgi:intein-encoded DNA endonuclease-like protein